MVTTCIQLTNEIPRTQLIEIRMSGLLLGTHDFSNKKKNVALGHQSTTGMPLHFSIFHQIANLLPSVQGPAMLHLA